MNKEQKPKILFLDIENTPIISYNWGRYEQNAIDVIQESYILSFAYKWYGDNKTNILSLNKYIGNKPSFTDSKAFIEDIHKIMSEADILCAHNGDAFDLKQLNTRFVLHGLTPIPPGKTVDTLKVARKYFSFSSNKLNDLGKRLGIGVKVETGGFDLWRNCMAGDKKSWEKMREYNLNDVVLLEKVYKKLLPWMRQHPIVGTYTGSQHGCSACGSDKLHSRGYVLTRAAKYRRYQCQSCGYWNRELQNLNKSKPLVGA